MFDSFNFLRETERQEILNKIYSKRIASLKFHPLKSQRYKLADKAIEVVRSLLGEIEEFNLEKRNLLNQLLGKLKSYKEGLKEDSSEITSVLNCTKMELFSLLIKASAVSPRVGEVIEFLKQQNWDLPRLLYLLMFFWSDKYDIDRINKVLGGSINILNRKDNPNVLSIELEDNVFLTVDIKRLAKREEEGKTFYEMILELKIVRLEDEQEIGEGKVLSNYHIRLVFPFDKLKQMWFTKPSDERPTYLEQDLKELDSC